MKKTILKIILVLVAFALLYFALLQFPQITLRKRIVYNNFEVYSHKNIKSNSDILNVLDSVQVMIDRSDLQVNGLKHRLFLAHGSFYEKLTLLSGQKAFAFSFQDKQVYLAKPDFENNTFARNNNEYEVRNMIQLIAHESIHNQQYYSYTQRKTASWINEGYPEYVTHLPILRSEDYKLSDAVKLVAETKGEEWLRSEYGYWDIWFYKYSRVLIEYLIDVKGMTIEEIVADGNLDDVAIFEEMLENVNTN